MNRSYVDFTIKTCDCKEGGSKEACILAHEFLKNTTIINGKIQTNDSSGVNVEEFIKAVRTLIAYSFPRDDQIPELWHCDSDCHYVNTIFCRGECQAVKGEEIRCPYFSDDANW